MPLDPQVAEFLDQLASSKGTGLLGFSPQTVDAADSAGAVLTISAELAHVEDRTICDGEGEPLPVRIYRPADAAETCGALTYCHGGGWVMNSIETHDDLCRRIACMSGCTVVSVDYRLAPRHKYPAAAEDAYAAHCWLARHASEFDLDPARLAVGGDSAGANLAAASCLMSRDRGGPPIAFQLLVYPITDFDFERASYRENGEGYFLTRDQMRWFWQHYLEREQQAREPYASPLRAGDHAGLPPAFILTAEFDPLRDEGEAYGDALLAAGVPAIVRRYEGMIHGFLRRTEVFDRAHDAIIEVSDALRRALTDDLPAPPAKPR